MVPNFDKKEKLLASCEKVTYMYKNFMFKTHLHFQEEMSLISILETEILGPTFSRQDTGLKLLHNIMGMLKVAIAG